MAGLKKSRRTKDTSSPNLVLVIFLIVFVLSNIVLGLLLYFSYDEKNKALDSATRAAKEKDGDRKAIKLYQTVADDFRSALGEQPKGDDMAMLDQERKQLLAENSQYGKGEKNTDGYKNLMAKLRGDLGFDDNTGEYKTTYKSEIVKAQKERDEALASLTKTQKQLKESQDQFKTLDEKLTAYVDTSSAKFDKDRKEVTRIASTQSEEMTKQIKKNDELREQVAELDQQRQKIERGYQVKIKELEAVIADKDKDRESTAGSRDNREPHALLLDISLGKPLWDDPVGTITRVEAKTKEVTINLGSAKGVRPDLTFSVFAPSKYIATRAEKQLKGTVEVVRVVGPHTSIARITSTFDPDFPLHEGDLLFNLFWGTRVAVTGYVDVAGATSESPSEQMRQLNDFLYLLSRQGVQVDAYLDLTDGQMKGAITPNTRYLIQGGNIPIDAKELADMAPRAQRALAVNNGIIAMRKDAIEKGIFVISDKNFATVIGYRPAGAGKDQTAFRPQLPKAGSVLPGLAGGVGAVGGPARVEAPMPMPMPMPEPKEKDKADPKGKAEPKEKEKG
jgi:hypothetical protein